MESLLNELNEMYIDDTYDYLMKIECHKRNVSIRETNRKSIARFKKRVLKQTINKIIARKSKRRGSPKGNNKPKTAPLKIDNTI